MEREEVVSHFPVGRGPESVAVHPVITHDLAKGVLAGVLFSAITFVWRIAKIFAQRYGIIQE